MKTRQCTNPPPSESGQTCQGSVTEVEKCSTSSCRVGKLSFAPLKKINLSQAVCQQKSFSLRLWNTCLIFFCHFLNHLIKVKHTWSSYQRWSMGLLVKLVFLQSNLWRGYQDEDTSVRQPTSIRKRSKLPRLNFRSRKVLNCKL